MSIDLSLPAFALDCRNWLVVDESDGLLPDDIDGVPLLAVLSTAVVDDDRLHSATAVLSLSLMDSDFDDPDFDDSDLDLYGPGGSMQPGGFGIPDIHVLSTDWTDGHARFVLPAPGGGLAVVAEFSSGPDPLPDLVDRFRDLVSSFRWAA